MFCFAHAVLISHLSGHHHLPGPQLIGHNLKPIVDAAITILRVLGRGVVKICHAARNQTATAAQSTAYYINACCAAPQHITLCE